MRPTVFRKTAAANNIDTAPGDDSSQRHKICSVHKGSPIFRQRLQKLYTFPNGISTIWERTVFYREQAVANKTIETIYHTCYFIALLHMIETLIYPL